MSDSTQPTLLYLRKGTLENLKKAPITPGALSFTTDERAIYLDTEDGQRIRFSDIVQVDHYADLTAITNPSTIAFYYPLDTNAFYKYMPDKDDPWVPVIGGAGEETSTDIAQIKSTLTTLAGVVQTLNSSVSANTTAIDTEKTRAMAEEVRLQGEITAEKTRAMGVEATLTQGINGLTAAYTQADAALKTQITSEYQQYVMDNLSVADAMTFKGEINSSKPLPTTGVSAGDTYKVTGKCTSPDGSTTYYIGDMVIATSDQSDSDATYQGEWVHVPSGYESSYDARLSGNESAKKISLLNGVGGTRGTITVQDSYTEKTGGLRLTVTNAPGSAGDAVTISADMVWGDFEQVETV